MTLSVRLHRSGQARLERLAGEQLLLRATEAEPPGAIVLASLSEARETFTIKVRACRRDGDEFVIVGRLVNLAREQRLRLAALFNAQDPV